MSRLEALQALLAKVEAGEGWPYLNLVFVHTDHLGLDAQGAWAEGAYNGSLDAAMALHDAVLPKATWMLGSAKPRALVHTAHDDAFNADSNTPARAWLIAILKALITQEQST